LAVNLLQSEETKEQKASSKPVLTFDLDGILCAPILGLNIGINRSFLAPEVAPLIAKIPPDWWRIIWDKIRFDSRRPMSDATEYLEQLQSHYSLILVTGRRTSPNNWLQRNGLFGYFSEIIWNTSEFQSAHYKLNTLNALHPVAHFEDDPRTAELLARSGVTVFLRDWPKNRNLHFNNQVIRIFSLKDASESLSKLNQKQQGD
jgi:hypothetical protein